MIGSATRLKEHTNGRPGFSLGASFALVIPALLIIMLLVPLGDIVLAVSTASTFGHLWQTVLPGYIINSLLLACGVSVVAASFALPTAWVMTQYRFAGKGWFEWALLLPLAIPPYLAAYSYGGLLEFAGPVQTALRGWTGWQHGDYFFPSVRSVGGASLVIGSVLYPYLYLLVRTSFNSQSGALLDSARALGIRHRMLFPRIALPMARPAIVAGLALIIMETLADFGAVQFLAVDTFTTGIYRTWFGRYDPIAAKQLAAMLFITIIAVLVLERTLRGAAGYTQMREHKRPPPRIRGWRALAAWFLCALPVCMGCVLPLGFMLWQAINFADIQQLDGLGASIVNSLSISFLAAAIMVCIALMLTYLLRLHSSCRWHMIIHATTFGYAVPGVVIAIGVLPPLLWMQGLMNTSLQAVMGDGAGNILLTSSVVALLYAYCIRFLALSFHTVHNGMAGITPAMDWSARTLGASPAQTVTRVHIPLIAPSMGAAFLLVFVEVFKELPATLIIRPFNFDTLATKAYGLASDERLADASLYGLLIVAVSVLPVWLLNRLIHRVGLQDTLPSHMHQPLPSPPHNAAQGIA